MIRKWRGLCCLQNFNVRPCKIFNFFLTDLLLLHRLVSQVSTGCRFVWRTCLG
jgi:hypothetical protein